MRDALMVKWRTGPAKKGGPWIDAPGSGVWTALPSERTEWICDATDAYTAQIIVDGHNATLDRGRLLMTMRIDITNSEPDNRRVAKARIVNRDPRGARESVEPWVTLPPGITKSFYIYSNRFIEVEEERVAE